MRVRARVCARVRVRSTSVVSGWLKTVALRPSGAAVSRKRILHGRGALVRTVGLKSCKKTLAEQLLAALGEWLAQLAEANNAALKFEAAVGGGIPVIKGLREGTSANALTKVYGILAQLLLTAVAALPFVLSGSMRNSVVHHGLPL